MPEILRCRVSVSKSAVKNYPPDEVVVIQSVTSLKKCSSAEGK